MNFSEREYFVYRVRSGVYLLDYEGLEIELKNPTVDDLFRANQLYMNVYDNCLKDRIMTQEEMQDFMLERGIWTVEKEQKIEDLDKNMEVLRLKIYEERNDPQMVNLTRKMIRRTEEVLKRLHAEKHSLSHNTCEGIATNDKTQYIFALCCYHNGERLDFQGDNCNALYYSWLPQVLRQGQVREIARTEPWRTMWSTKDLNELFVHEKTRELNIDQKNVAQWSTMYDSIGESHEPPSQQVLDDDDMLDGWFIANRKKREQQENESEVDSRIKNDNISNKQEVYVMAKGSKDAKNINSANSPSAKMIKKQRQAVIERKGKAVDLDFRDRKMGLQAEANRRR